MISFNPGLEALVPAGGAIEGTAVPSCSHGTSSLRAGRLNRPALVPGDAGAVPTRDPHSGAFAFSVAPGMAPHEPEGPIASVSELAGASQDSCRSVLSSAVPATRCTKIGGRPRLCRGAHQGQPATRACCAFTRSARGSARNRGGAAAVHPPVRLCGTRLGWTLNGAGGEAEGGEHGCCRGAALRPA